MTSTYVVEPEALLRSLIGKTITEGESTEDGLHFYLSDGRVVIFQGMFLVSVCLLEDSTVTIQ